jgi:hypothetical protein
MAVPPILRTRSARTIGHGEELIAMTVKYQMTVAKRRSADMRSPLVAEGRTAHLLLA